MGHAQFLECDVQPAVSPSRHMRPARTALSVGLPTELGAHCLLSPADRSGIRCIRIGLLPPRARRFHSLLGPVAHEHRLHVAAREHDRRTDQHEGRTVPSVSSDRDWSGIRFVLAAFRRPEALRTRSISTYPCLAADGDFVAAAIHRHRRDPRHDRFLYACKDPRTL